MASGGARDAAAEVSYPASWAPELMDMCEFPCDNGDGTTGGSDSDAAVSYLVNWTPELCNSGVRATDCGKEAQVFGLSNVRATFFWPGSIADGAGCLVCVSFLAAPVGARSGLEGLDTRTSGPGCCRNSSLEGTPF
jgi:hypothetical protein